MRQLMCQIRVIREVADHIFMLRFSSDYLSTTAKAGQFINIRADESTEPLLRRPYSLYHTNGSDVEILFNIVGRGSAALRKKREGDQLDVLGPLGVPFTLDSFEYDTAVLVGGGMGVAPLPLATVALKALGKRCVALLGARTSHQVVDTYLEDVQIATDDGSRGFHGNVVDLAKHVLASGTLKRPKLFACGPTAMLRAVAGFAIERNIPCEVSLEGAMACGFGVCQGCPVELVGNEKKYALMCKDGPTFDVRKIKI